MAEDTLFFKEMTSTRGFRNPAGSEAGRVGFINLVKNYAALNRKNMRHTDNKGYPLSYLVEVEAIGNTSQAHEIEIFTAPENWVLKNAVRKWHAARNVMLDRLGMLGKIGEYGKTIRPYLSVNHATMGDAVPTLFALDQAISVSGGSAPSAPAVDYHESSPAVNPVAMNGGEWTYTEIAATTDIEELQESNITDRYHLVLTGDHDNAGAGSESSNARYYTHVSMMRSYLESRRNVSTVIQNESGGGTIQDEPNPLANLMSDSVSVGEVKEIVKDIQREKPPYDAFGVNATNALGGNDALDLVSKCLLSTTTSYLKDKEVIRVPMGLLHVRASAGGDIGSSDVVPGLRFRLLGIDKCQG